MKARWTVKARFAVLVATAALMTSCARKSAEESLASARSLLERQDGPAAVVELKSMLQNHPDSAEGRFLLGKTLLELQQTELAEIELTKAGDLGMDPARLAPLRIRALVAGGQAAKAMSSFGSTRAASPEVEAELKLALSGAAAALGRVDDAEKLIDEALAASPKLTAARLDKARLLAHRADAKAALAILDDLSKEPGTVSAEAWSLKAEILSSRMSDHDGALRAYGEALRAQPGHFAAHRGIVLLSLAKGDIAAATAQVAAAKRDRSGDAAVNLLDAMVSFGQKDYAATHQKLQPLLAAAPGNAVLLELAGATEYHLGSLDAADGLLTGALKRNPGLTLAKNTLIQLYLSRGQGDKALALLAPALKVERPAVEALAMAAQAQLQVGDAKAAEELFARAQKSSPKDTRLATGLALARSAQRPDKEAATQLQAASKGDARGMTADLALINHHLSRRNWVQAMEALDALEKKRPGLPITSALRGQVQVGQGDVPAARASFEAALKLAPGFLPAAMGLAGIDLRDGKADAARQRMEAIVAAEPGNMRAQVALADVLERSGAPSSAVDAQLAKAVEAAPTSPEAHLRLINHLLLNGQAQAALTAAQAATAALPGSPVLQHARARALMAAGDYQQASKDLTALTQVLPRSPQLQTDLAHAALGMNDLGGAERYLRKALEFAPEYAMAQQALVAVLMRARRHEPALTLAKDVQKRQPNAAIGFILEGDVLMDRRNWEGALAAYQRALREDNSATVGTRLHQALSAARRDDEAARMATAWLKDHPGDVPFRSYLADLAVARGAWADAEAAYKEVLRLQPAHPGALNNLAMTLLRQSKDGALALTERARQSAPRDPAVLETHGLALAHAGQTGQAAELLADLAQRHPNLYAIRLSLARVLMQAGNRKEAREQLETLSRLGSRFNQQAEVERLLAKT